MGVAAQVGEVAAAEVAGEGPAHLGLRLEVQDLEDHLVVLALRLEEHQHLQGDHAVQAHQDTRDTLSKI